MGADYDFVLSPAEDAVQHIESFLSERELTVHSVAELAAVSLNDDRAVLISPGQAGRVQIVADCSSLMVDLANWFECNPLAAALSRYGRPTLHLWSLDSGFVAGYSAYDDGKKVEADHVFSKHAVNTEELMKSVPAPRTQAGDTLQKFLRTADAAGTPGWKQSAGLERGIARLAADMGFGVHLVDFYEALDDQIGMAVVGDDYRDVDLSSWTAIVFDSIPKSPCAARG